MLHPVNTPGKVVWKTACWHPDLPDQTSPAKIVILFRRQFDAVSDLDYVSLMYFFDREYTSGAVLSGVW